MIELIMAAVGTILVVFWCFCWHKGKRQYDEYIEALNPADYLFVDLYPVGFQAMDVLRVDVKNYSVNKKQRKQLVDLYGEQDIDFYLYVQLGGQYTYVLTTLPIGLMLGAAIHNLFLALFFAVIGIGLAYNMPQKTQEKYKKREEEIQLQLPTAISTMVLLLNANMTPSASWAHAADMGEDELYVELKKTLRQANSGIPMEIAVRNMGDRSSSKELKKFCAAYQQALTKSEAELVNVLMRMNEESWETKRNMAKRKGDLAGQGLLMPTLLMFVGLMAMIIVPVFANMSI